MYHSNNSLAGSPSFTVSTKHLEDGRWEAQAPHIEGMTPEVADSEVEAVREMQIKLQRWLLTGAPRLTR